MVHNTQNYCNFLTSSIAMYSKNYRAQHFGNWICFCPQMREIPTLLGPLQRGNLSHHITHISYFNIQNPSFIVAGIGNTRNWPIWHA
jgi:hypothetical protein